MFSNTYVFIHVHVYHVSNLFTYWYLIRDKYDIIQMRLLNDSHECNNSKEKGEELAQKGNMNWRQPCDFILSRTDSLLG